MKRRFKDIAFRDDALVNIERANTVIERYQEAGLRLTARQLYYQFVTQNWVPNTERSYKNLTSLISKARLAGLIDWDAIEDRGRVPDVPQEFESIRHLTETALRAYRLPRWKGQCSYVELWVEKQALAGVLEPLASEFHVTLMVNKGYSSQSAMYDSAKRYLRRSGQDPILLYLGDHDPSGEDMVRDIRDRMELFGVSELAVEKVALTMDQIRRHKPPPNPAKLSDPRAAAYMREHGHSSWEVDALPPDVLADLIRTAFLEVVDLETMDGVKKQEEIDKKRLREAAQKIIRDG